MNNLRIQVEHDADDDIIIDHLPKNKKPAALQRVSVS